MFHVELQAAPGAELVASYTSAMRRANPTVGGEAPTDPMQRRNAGLPMFHVEHYGAGSGPLGHGSAGRPLPRTPGFDV